MVQCPLQESNTPEGLASCGNNDSSRRTGMKPTLKMLITLTFALVAPPAWHAASAAESRASIQVLATVLPHASVESLIADSPVFVTTADIERGYLDVARAYQLRSNTTQGLLVQLNPRVGLARQIDIDGFGYRVQVNETNVEVRQPAKASLELRFRLWLQPGAAPGDYELPLHIAAIAL